MYIVDEDLVKTIEVNLLEEISTHVDLDNKKGDELRRLFEEQKTKKFHIIVHGSITK